MFRPLRVQHPDAWYHVMNRGRRGESIFREKKDYLGFVELPKEVVDMWNVNVAGYCLMSTHYHALIQTPEANLPRCMRHLNAVHTKRFNRSHLLDGQLFRGRYKSILIEADSYLLELIRYIHRNPAEAGVVERMEKYPWSSHKGYLSDAKKWNWLYKDYVLSMFSDDRRESRKRYKEFVRKEIAEEINEVLGRKKLPATLGSEDFIAWVKRKFFGKKRHIEVPQSRVLAPDVERIKEAVSKVYEVNKETLLVSRRGIPNEPRNVLIYLMRQLRADSLNEIARELNINKYSTVSSVIERTKDQMGWDRKLRKRVKELKSELT